MQITQESVIKVLSPNKDWMITWNSREIRNNSNWVPEEVGKKAHHALPKRTWIAVLYLGDWMMTVLVEVPKM